MKDRDVIYVIIEDLSEGLDSNYWFNTYEEARKYLDEIVEEYGKDNLFENFDDGIIFDNDDMYLIKRINRYKRNK
jgi:hypothetical protein